MYECHSKVCRVSFQLYLLVLQYKGYPWFPSLCIRQCYKVSMLLYRQCSLLLMGPFFHAPPPKKIKNYSKYDLRDIITKNGPCRKIVKTILLLWHAEYVFVKKNHFFSYGTCPLRSIFMMVSFSFLWIKYSLYHIRDTICFLCLSIKLN